MFVQISETMRMLRSPLLLLFFLLISIDNWGQTTENALLWKISGNGITHPSYLLGTYHLLNNEFLDELEGCKEALKKCDVVMGELEVTPEIAAEMMPYMLLEEGSLDELMNDAQYDSLNAFVLEHMGMPMTLFTKMKPIGIYMMLAATEMQKTSLVSEYKGVPMDVYVQNQARKNKKEIIGLETVKDQSELLFNSSPIERQVEMLMEYVRKDATEAAEMGKSESDKMNACYKAQDLNCLDSLMQHSGYSEIESNLLLKDRNENWVPNIIKNIRKQDCFIAVGALHLAGENGLIRLLRQEGYTLSPVHSKKDIDK